MQSLDKRNEELNKKIGTTDLPNAVAILVKDAQKRRRQVRWLAFSIILDVILTFAFGYISIQTHKAALQAESNAAAIVRSCETSNEARANNKQLWDYLFALTPTEKPTPAEQKQLDQFRAVVNKTFAPRDCNNIQ